MDDIKFVINYDYPLQNEDYVHRQDLGFINSLTWHAVFSDKYPDPHWLDSPGSGSVMGMRLWIQEQDNWLKLTNKPNFQPFKMALVPT